MAVQQSTNNRCLPGSSLPFQWESIHPGCNKVLPSLHIISIFGHLIDHRVISILFLQFMAVWNLVNNWLPIKFHYFIIIMHIFLGSTQEDMTCLLLTRLEVLRDQSMWLLKVCFLLLTDIFCNLVFRILCLENVSWLFATRNYISNAGITEPSL